MGLCASAVIIDDDSSCNGASKSITLPSTLASEGEILRSPNLECFQFSELKAATKNFSLIRESQGSFDFCVYKGWIDEHSLKAATSNTGMAVAVHNLPKNMSQGQQEWLTQIKYLGQLRHPNIVKLIGYCTVEDHRLLVYEFMPKGNLENHLYKRVSHSQPLSWTNRMKIALGAAKALAFLHNEAKVIYRNFKTSSILLDSNYNAKLCDFGFAKDGPVDGTSHVTTRVIGTIGYVAPEYEITGHLTPKADVYNFGIVLLVLITGRSAVMQNDSLVKWAIPFLRNKYRIFQIFDASIGGASDLNKARKMANLALQCVSEQPKARPQMEQVVNTLEQIILD